MTTRPWTSGPWEYSFEDLRGGRYHTVQRPGRDIESIDLRADENGEADARLIAAAPDMAEALISVLQYTDMMIDAGAFRAIKDDLVFDRARAALEKAGWKSDTAPLPQEE